MKRDVILKIAVFAVMYSVASSRVVSPQNAPSAQITAVRAGRMSLPEFMAAPHGDSGFRSRD